VKLLGFATREEALSGTLKGLSEDLSSSGEGNVLSPDGIPMKRHERVLHRKDGTVLHVFETNVGIFNESDELIGVRGFLQEQSVEVKLEERLLQRQKLESLGWFAGGFIHDFNNILVILLGNCSLLEKKLSKQGEDLEIIRSMNQALDRGIDLAQSFLTYTRTHEVTVEVMNVNSVITGLSKMVEAALPKSIKLELELDERLPTFAMNPIQIQQAVINLCMNARDAMADTSAVRSAVPVLKIRTSQVESAQSSMTPSQLLCIEVSDTGKGMNASLTQKIFEPFFTTKERGTGLGLAIVQMVTKKHDGYIEVTSKEGEGTTVKLLFPVPHISLDQRLYIPE
jgi:nitrogen-specific signal transduction histidine kinase